MFQFLAVYGLSLAVSFSPIFVHFPIACSKMFLIQRCVGGLFSPRPYHSSLCSVGCKPMVIHANKVEDMGDELGNAACHVYQDSRRDLWILDMHAWNLQRDVIACLNLLDPRATRDRCLVCLHLTDEFNRQLVDDIVIPLPIL